MNAPREFSIKIKLILKLTNQSLIDRACCLENVYLYRICRQFLTTNFVFTTIDRKIQQLTILTSIGTRLAYVTCVTTQLGKTLIKRKTIL